MRKMRFRTTPARVARDIPSRFAGPRSIMVSDTPIIIGGCNIYETGPKIGRNLPLADNQKNESSNSIKEESRCRINAQKDRDENRRSKHGTQMLQT